MNTNEYRMIARVIQTSTTKNEDLETFQHRLANALEATQTDFCPQKFLRQCRPAYKGTLKA